MVEESCEYFPDAEVLVAEEQRNDEGCPHTLHGDSPIGKLMNTD
jgi:hypothetical protein